MAKVRISMVEANTHVMESTIGFEENRRLREELDKLHEEYNGIVD